MRDPVVAGLVSFSKRNARLIAGAIAIFAALGLGAAVIWPASFSARSLVLTATTANNGPFEKPELVARRVAQAALAASFDGTLPDTVKVEANPVIAQPPVTEKSPAIELRAKGRSSHDVALALDFAESQILAAQAKLYAQERARVDAELKRLGTEVEHTEAAPASVDTHESMLFHIRELTRVGREVSPARAMPPQVLARSPVELQPLGMRVAFALALALPFGVLAGYGLAFARTVAQLAPGRPSAAKGSERSDDSARRTTLGAY